MNRRVRIHAIFELLVIAGLLAGLVVHANMVRNTTKQIASVFSKENNEENIVLDKGFVAIMSAMNDLSEVQYAGDMSSAIAAREQYHSALVELSKSKLNIRLAAIESKVADPYSLQLRSGEKSVVNGTFGIRKTEVIQWLTSRASAIRVHQTQRNLEAMQFFIALVEPAAIAAFCLGSLLVCLYLKIKAYFRREESNE